MVWTPWSIRGHTQKVLAPLELVKRSASVRWSFKSLEATWNASLPDYCCYCRIMRAHPESASPNVIIPPNVAGKPEKSCVGRPGAYVPQILVHPQAAESFLCPTLLQPSPFRQSLSPYKHWPPPHFCSPCASSSSASAKRPTLLSMVKTSARHQFPDSLPGCIRNFRRRN